MNYIRCLFAAIISIVPTLAQAADLEIVSAPQNPTPQECAAIAGHNSRVQQSLVAQHERCLSGSASATLGEYKRANPCSKLACRSIHLQMDSVRERIAAIAGDCQSRISMETKIGLHDNAGQNAAEDVTTQTEVKKWALRIDDLLNKTNHVVEIVKNRDRPWNLVEPAWGEAAAKIREEFADRISGGATKDNLDWSVYDLIFNKAYDAQIGNAQAAGNPLARIINEAMLSRLHTISADVYGQLDRTLMEIERDSAQFPTPSTSRHPKSSNASRSNSPEGFKPTSRSQECAIFQDMEGSSALLDNDPGTWMALNDQCNGAR
ncbi:MAG: hypothetical protein IT391_14610 [Nitrospira sp.]|nr:hypothetical protein [Nitrospira sp.]